MIRRVINRLRRQEPSQKHAQVFTPERGPSVAGAPATLCGGSPRRGRTRRPLGMVRLQNRQANRVARASRKTNR